MTTVKLMFQALLAALVFIAPSFAQELDGTLKKIKESSTLNLGHLESAPPFSFPGRIGGRSAIPLTSAPTLRAAFRSDWEYL